MATYSFKNIKVAIAGPGLVANLGDGAAVAEEGITIEAAEDKNTMQIGVDGRGQHSLIASDAGTITIRLLKTSPANFLLSAAYDLQSSSSALWGKNTITIIDSARGDITTVQEAAFKKKPALNYTKEAGMTEWVFDAVKIDTILGVG